MKKTTKPCNSPPTITTARLTDNIPLICTGAGPIHPVHSQPMSLATEAMPEMRLHFCHFPAVFYICVYMYIYKCIYVHVRFYLCVLLRTCTGMFALVCMYMYVHVCVYIPMHTYIYTYIHICIYIYICVYMCKYI